MTQSPVNTQEIYSQVISLLENVVKSDNSEVMLTQIHEILTNQTQGISSPNDTEISTVVKDKFSYFCLKTEALLEQLYEPSAKEKLLTEIYSLLKDSFAESVAENLHKWDQSNVQLITYGDSVIQDNESEKPLVTLARFLDKYWQGSITGVHILPFNPYSSDDGFAVIDYLQVNPNLGNWDDIRYIATKFNLMVDLVINHVSSQHRWFQQFKEDLKPGCNYFITADPQKDDLSQVVRPRSTPLLTEVETKQGTKYVWSTFSDDQIDVNFANPDVLLEYLKIIVFYVKLGAKYIRLDAVGFLWKQLGTSCIHLPQTHTVIRLLREILQILDPSIAIITETNVPNHENLSYFGNGNEAHMIYNFSLPPLLLNALMQGKSDHLKTWTQRMRPASRSCAYFNFTASHDGIGLRPAEGLLSDDELQTLLETMEQFGGKISYRQKPDGSHSPYEINISWFSAMKGTVKGEDEYQIDRFICSQIIMLGLEGIPAFYIHSLLATPNDEENLQRTGHNRSINRHKWSYSQLEALLADSNTNQAIIWRKLSKIIKIRGDQPAFHPNATQYTLHPLNNSLFAFWRQSINREQSVFCIHNLSNKPQNLILAQLNLIDDEKWFDLITYKFIDDIYQKYILKPYQCLWLTNYLS